MGVNPFESSFTALKIRYADYDGSIHNAHFIEDADSVNVFINMESVFVNLSMIQDLERKLVLNRDFEVTLASGIINLAAHYKRFFTSNQFNTRVYLYHTDFNSTSYAQLKYNENYRSYYTCKYLENPKFSMLTDSMIDSILPLVRKCCEFIPGVYYITAKNMEGSVIPYLINELDKKMDTPRKNFIIGNELYDTQYEFLSGFLCHYINRSFTNYYITCNVDDIISGIAKKPKTECKDLVNMYSCYPFYTSLLSCIGDKMRSIDGVDGVGIKTLYDLLTEGVDTNRIQKDTTSPTVLGDIFKKDEMRDIFINNYYCTSIPNIYTELTESDILAVRNQIIDRYDNRGLVELNSRTFYNHPLLLEALCT